VRLPGFVVLCQAAVKSIDTDSGAVELSHDKTVFFDKIADGFFLVEDSLKPLVLLHVALYDFLLRVKDVAEMLALTEHGWIRPLSKSAKL
jgi:hypothetical protein